MRIPRDISGELLIRRLERVGYVKVRQRGSHITIRTEVDGRHSLHIPNHKSIRTGMLESILKDAAEHHRLSPEELLEKLGI